MKTRLLNVPFGSLGRRKPKVTSPSVIQASKPGRSWKVAYLVSSLAYLVFVAHQPVAIYAMSPHDDGLFWTHATNMLSGNWLGAYSQMTLPKGVGFPILIALGAILSIPVHVVAAIVLIGCLAILLSTLRIINIPELALFGIFIATLSQSSLIMERPLRENLYSSLTLVLIALAIQVVSGETEKSIQRVFLLGLVAGVFLVTREESIWVVPGILVVIFGGWVLAKRPKFFSLFALRSISSALLGVLVAPLIVGVLNLSYYGTFKTEDFTTGNFPRALEALQSVTEEPSKRWVPVTLQNREAIYAVSDSFNELRPYFEGPGMGWTEHGCKALKDLCGEYGAGWFMWALRDAVASRGYYSSPERAEAFYGRLSEEIEEACKSGILECNGGGFWIMPELNEEAVRGIFPTIFQGFDILTLEGNQPTVLGSSSGDANRVFLIRSILGSPQVMPLPMDDSAFVTGWYLGAKGDRGSFGVKCRPDSAQPSVTWLPSPDLVLAFGDENAGQSRFEFSYPASGDCRIVFGEAESPATLSLKDMTSGSQTESVDFQIKIESIIESRVEEPFLVALMLKNGLSDLNAIMNSIFFWLGGVALMLAIVSTIVRRSRYLGINIIVAGIYVLIISRVALLALVSVTSFPALNELYLMPAFALISLAGILSSYSLIREIRYWAPRMFPAIHLAGSRGPLFRNHQAKE